MSADDGLLPLVIEQVLERQGPMEIVLRPESALHLAGLVQLAMRHPALGESSRQIGVSFLEHVREYFADVPAILEVLRRGDLPRYDR